MNKRIFAIFLVAIFLIVSVGVISAADDQSDVSADVDVKKVSNSKVISVKIVWDDADKTGARPDSVKVNLVKDGVVVDEVTLSESNSWSATFKAQSGDGTFKVTQSGNIGDYSVSTSGNADNGFIIVNKVKADVLGASEDETPLAEDTSDDAKDVEGSTPDDDVIGDENDTETNSTEEESDSSDDNATDEETASDDANTTEEETASDDANTTEEETASDGANATDVETTSAGPTEKVIDTPTKNPVTKEKVKKVIKPLKKNNVTKEKLKNTGIPLMVLVVAVFTAIFVPISGRKK